jgi:hypothetical protein
MSAPPVILLDASDSRRRLLQQGLPLAGAGLLLCGIGVLVSSAGRGWLVGGVLITLGVLAVAAAPALLVSWEVDYKGHRIRFENSPVFGERLFIDGERISDGPLGYAKTLRGVIRSGDGAGERITAQSTAGLFQFRCRIVAGD